MKRTIVFYLITLPLIFSCHFKNHSDENFSGGGFSSRFTGGYDNNDSVDKIRLFITSPAKDSVRISFWEDKDNLIAVDTTVADTGPSFIEKKWHSESDNLSYDFTFSLDPNDTDHVKVEWDSLWAGPTVVKSYLLQRRTFAYSTDWGQYPQSSQRPLVDSDVNNLYKGDLQEMRNEIYARHGYCFKNSSWQSDFEYTDWYIPYTPDVSKDLTDIEKKNLTLIKKYEKTAKDEDFGRQ